MTLNTNAQLQDEAEAIGRSWYVVPSHGSSETKWLVYTKEMLLATLQGCAREPHRVRLTATWNLVGALAQGCLAVVQGFLMLLAWIPVLSWIMEILARTFTRNSVGFLLRACYWKCKLKSLGQDTLIDQGVEIWGADNVSIGSHCHIDTNVRMAAGNRWQGQDGLVKIGDYVHVGPGVHIAGRGGVEIQNFVSLAAQAHLYSASNTVEHPDDPGRLISMSHMAPHEQQFTVEGPIVLEEYAFIGMMTRVLPGVRVGRGAIIHANCELTQSVPPFSSFGGVAKGRKIGWRRPRRRSPMIPAVERPPLPANEKGAE